MDLSDPLINATADAQLLAARSARLMLRTDVRRQASARERPPVYAHLDQMVSATLSSAAPFGWTHEMADLCWHAAESLPEDERFEESLMPAGVSAFFWWFERPLSMVCEWRDPYQEFNCDEIVALLGVNVPSSRTLQIFELRDWRADSPKRGPVRFLLTLNHLKIPWGESVTDLLQPNPEIAKVRALGVQPYSWSSLASARFVLAACLFLQTRVVQLREVPLERHTRKRFTKELEIAEAPAFRVVHLRERTPTTTGQHHESEIEHHCRWMVRKHTRWQRYRDGHHRPTMVKAHIKGPPDKPLKMPARPFFKVDR